MKIYSNKILALLCDCDHLRSRIATQKSSYKRSFHEKNKKGPTPASPKFKIHEILPYEYVILLDVQNTGGNPNVTAKFSSILFTYQGRRV